MLQCIDHNSYVIAEVNPLLTVYFNRFQLNTTAGIDRLVRTLNNKRHATPVFIFPGDSG